MTPRSPGKKTVENGKVEIVLNVPSGRTVNTLNGEQNITVELQASIPIEPLIIDVLPVEDTGQKTPDSFFEMDKYINRNNVLAEQQPVYIFMKK